MKLGYQLYIILSILYFYRVFLHVFSHERHKCLKARIFHKKHRGLEIFINPKLLTVEMATHQGDSVIHALVCTSKGKKMPVCFLIFKKILHVAGFGGIIKVEQLVSKLRPPPATLGTLLTSGPDFAIYPKGWIVH